MLTTNLIKAWIDADSKSGNREYFPFFIFDGRRFYSHLLYEKVAEAIKRIPQEKLNEIVNVGPLRVELLAMIAHSIYVSDKKHIISKLLKSFQTKLDDPFGNTHTYTPKKQNEIDNILKCKFYNTNEQIKQLTSKLILALKSLSWSLTTENLPLMSESFESPYKSEKLDHNEHLFIRSFFNLKIPIWEHSLDYDFNKVNIYTIHKGKHVKIDFYGNYFGENVSNYHKVRVEVDGRIINTNEIINLTNKINKLTEFQMNHFRSLSPNKQLQKVMELNYFLYKDIFDVINENWIPTIKEYSAIKDKEPSSLNLEDDSLILDMKKHLDACIKKHKLHKFIANIDEIKLTDYFFYGGKTVKLAHLKQKKFNIPKTITLTTEAYLHFIEENNISDAISTLNNLVNTKDVNELEVFSNKIKYLIINGKIPQIIEDDITSQIHKFNKIAIRSSAVDEDSSQNSFAGQHDSYINIPKENILEHIKKCWASLYNKRAIYYRKKNNIDDDNIAMAVIIQEVIEPLYSGVAFTKNANQESDDMIIETFKGYGENIVEGKIIPHKISIPNNNPNTAILNDNNNDSNINYKKLYDTFKDIETIFAHPQDIEFVIDKNQNLYILQSRNITTLAPQKTKSQVKIKGKLVTKGTCGSYGISQGKAKIIKTLEDLKHVKENDIIIAKVTSPDFVFVMDKIKGIITQLGGINSHAAIVSRELNIPCIVGAKDIFEKVNENDIITMNAKTGEIYLNEKNNN